MDDRNISSEEKLLKVIRRQDKIRQKNEPAGAIARTSPGSGVTSNSVGILGFLNRVFIVAAIAFFALATHRYLTLVKDPGDIGDILPLPSGNVRVEGNKVRGFFGSDFASGQNRAWERDLFEAPWEKPQLVEDVVPESGEVVNPAPDLASIFRLAGIVMDQNESQVIVEDLQQGETIFVSRGQDVLGARLVEIFEDRAVFIYQNERVELTP